jgi:hypothetical protein
MRSAAAAGHLSRQEDPSRPLYQPRGVEAVAVEVLGEELEDRTPTGLWPSDHAGVVAPLHLAHP